MTKDIKQKTFTREQALRAFDEVLRPLYLEVEASIAEDLHVRIAEKTLELLDRVHTDAIREERAKVKYELHRLDWIKCLYNAIKGRPTSFAKDPIWEWRNAADQVYGSLLTEAENKGILPDITGKLSVHDSQEEKSK